MQDSFHRFISRKLGIDAHYLFRNGLWVSLRYASIALIGLATTVVFTHLALPEVYGAYQYVLSSVAFFSFLSLPGMNVAALKSVVRGNDRAIFTVMRWSFLSGLLGIPAILTYSFLHQGETLSPTVLIIAAAAFAPFYALNTWYVYYEGRQDFFAVAWRAILLALATFGVLWAALCLDASLMVLVGLYFATGILCSGVFALEVWQRIRQAPVPKERQDGRLEARYGLALTGQKLVFNASEMLPLMLIGLVFGFAEVAYFQVAYFIYASVSGYVGALVAMYLPKLFLGTTLEKKKLLTHNLLAGILAACGTSLFLLAVFPLFFRGEYQMSLVIAWLLVPSVILLPLKSYLTSFFVARQQITFLTYAYLGSTVIAAFVFTLVVDRGAGTAGSLFVATLVILTTLIMGIRYWSDNERQAIV